jgi:Rab-like protein 2
MDHLIESKVKQASELAPCDVKIILLGDSAVGKSKLVERFLINDYEERQLSTYALTMFRHTTNFEGQDLKIDIWDTAGQECFNNLHPSFYFGAHACILVFDVTRKLTYANLKNWYKEMRTYCPDIPCVLIANKIDVNMDVTKKSRWDKCCENF